MHAGRWPWATFLANLAGARARLGGDAAARAVAADGLPPAAHRERPVRRAHHVHTLQLEVVELGRDGHARLAGAYLATSVAARAGGGGGHVRAGPPRRAPPA